MYTRAAGGVVSIIHIQKMFLVQVTDLGSRAPLEALALYLLLQGADPVHAHHQPGVYSMGTEEAATLEYNANTPLPPSRLLVLLPEVRSSSIFGSCGSDELPRNQLLRFETGSSGIVSS